MTACLGDNAGGSTSSQMSSIAITNQLARTQEHLVESVLKSPVAVQGYQLMNHGNPLLGWSVRGNGTSVLPETPPLIFLIEAH